VARGLGLKAQYKGTGTINSSGNYDFTLTAYDGNISGGGGTDRFRIRITDGNNGNAVIFDNKNGTPTDMDVANPQVISGGRPALFVRRTSDRIARKGQQGQCSRHSYGLAGR